MREVDARYEEFVTAETPRLLRVAYGLTGNPHDAWDLVQEALVRVGMRWRQVGEGNPGGYAHTTLVRLNIDRGRRLSRERLPGRLPDHDAPVRVDAVLDPDLVAALLELPRQQRAAVVLRAVEDLDHAAIAARLGCSVGTARSHLSRGLARLREVLAAQEVDRDH